MNINVTFSASPELLDVLKTIADKLTVGANASEPAPAKRNGKSKVVVEENLVKELTDNAASNGAIQLSEKNLADIQKEATTETVKSSVNEGPITIEAVRAAVQTKAQAGKRTEIKALLTKFDVENVTGLAATQYKEFLADVNAL